MCVCVRARVRLCVGLYGAGDAATGYRNSPMVPQRRLDIGEGGRERER